MFYLVKVSPIARVTSEAIGPLQPNVARMFIKWHFTKSELLVLIEDSILLPGRIMSSDCLN